ncbi:putative Ig domain-containing protein [Burkholderia lata]|uniref:Oxidase n=1 Tax=Burkholderia lata (strain ATCC 17760 / DSM 23089 / LMG 22485 / NCIMB 9086 / R18194 / 383) TaxID=482957 RepID=A0A6P2JE23_BURL3|nr:putative Ig domain-containing protein [Burkholderia lata]VWB42369.1 oxidase [Burkholderia lata]
MIRIGRKLWPACGLVLAVSLTGCGGGDGSGDQNVSRTTDSAVVSPAGLSYLMPVAVYRVGESITPNTPSSSGSAITIYSISPALPAGLVQDPRTGVISGVPSTVASSEIYTVTGNNAQGSVTARMQIEVKPLTVAPAAIAYGNEAIILTAGKAVTGIVPVTSGGGAAQFTISPPLPSGLALDPATGAIVGTPTAATGPASYRVTGSNSAGNATTQFTLEVREAVVPPLHLEYANQTVTYKVGQVIAPNVPKSAGGSITQYAVSPALPEGLSLNAQTGAIGGTPTRAQGPMTFLISGSNGAGTIQAQLNISVILATSGEWVPGGSMFEARAWHTATLLSSGEVLVAGGVGTGGLVDMAERYNPVNGAWALAGKMQTSRTEHTATRLANGKVLVAGGTTTRTAELYDPSTGTWTPVGHMKRGRSKATSTLLPDGRVLVVGGIEIGDFGTYVAEAELFDPVSGTWTTTGSLNVARAHHIATLLPGGRVLVAGGGSPAGITATAELYDVRSGTWTLARDMNVKRSSPTAAMLPNGKVLVAGGTSASLTAEQYDPVTGAWTLTGPMVMPRVEAQATGLPDGRVVVTGNYDASYSGNGTSAEIFDPATGNWAAIANMSDPRSMHAATLLTDGSVLVTGSYHHTRLYASSERFR